MSSYYDDASLMLLASGGAQKDGKVYSVKPTDGSGDFTFTRGSNLSATRVNASQLIEKGRENLLLQSNQFDTTWTNANTTETSGQSGYDGTNDAWLLTGSGAFPRLMQNVSVSGVNTISVYAKANTNNYLIINMLLNGVGATIIFDISSGVQTTNISEQVSSKLTDVGSGWWRVESTINGSIGSLALGLSNDGTISGWVNFTSGSLYIQDAQLESSLVATPYIETGATTAQAGILENTPRFDYSGGATCPSLLLEPSRTNVLPYSEYFGSSEWTKTRCTITDNYAISPEGVQNAALMTATDDDARLEDSITLSGDYTQSIWVKSGQSGNVEGQIDFAGAATKTFTANQEWQRVETTNDSFHRLRVRVTNSGDKLLIFGAQLELGSYATSYIPTYGVSQTRAGEVCGGAGDAATFNDSEGVLYAEIEALANDGTNRMISLTNGVDTTSNATIYFIPTANQIRYIYEISSSQQCSIVANVNVLQYNKFAIVYKLNRFELWGNGVKLGEDTSGTLNPEGTFTKLSFFRGASQLPFYGKTKQLIYFPTALSDLDLAILTGATTYNTFAEMALALNYTVYE